MSLWSDPPGEQYLKGDPAWEREDWSKSKSEMEEKGKNLKNNSIWVSNYRVARREGYYVLYVR